MERTEKRTGSLWEVHKKKSWYSKELNFEMSILRTGEYQPTSSTAYVHFYTDDAILYAIGFTANQPGPWEYSLLLTTSRRHLKFTVKRQNVWISQERGPLKVPVLSLLCMEI